MSYIATMEKRIWDAKKYGWVIFAKSSVFGGGPKGVPNWLDKVIREKGSWVNDQHIYVVKGRVFQYAVQIRDGRINCVWRKWK